MFWRKKQLISPIKSVSHPVFQWGEDDIPRYPPFMKGLPVVPPSKLIETQKELVDRIANSTIATPEVFQKHYLAAIERFASFSHLLPASQSHHHRGAGGLLRHAIEVGLWALQSADRVLIKSAVSPMHRREMEPRWQLAVFLAGMCHDAGKPVTDLTVTNKERTSTWHPITEDLFSWAIKNSVHAYFLEWREGRGKQHTALSSLIAERIIGAESLSWIAEVDTDLVVWLMESLAGTPGPTNLICDLVNKADQTSVERDLKTLGVAMAGYDLGVPVERHLIDIMRRFVREGMWLVNIPGARLWNIEGHLYLVWPAAGEELARQIKEDGVPGMPRTPDGILDMLTDRGMAFLKEDVSPEERLWKISPAVLAEKIPDIKLTAIRLRDEAIVSSIPLPSAPGRIISTVQAGATMTDSNAMSLQSRDAQTVPDALSKDHPTEVTRSPLPLEISTRTIVTEAKNLKKPRSAVMAPIHLDGAIG
ncbi:MAG: MobH family relaxase, partial [Pseudomonadota bacterium]